LGHVAKSPALRRSDDPEGAIIDHMSETLQYPSEPTTAPQPVVMTSAQPYPPHLQTPPPYRPSRLNKVAAWVGIVAGSLVIIAVLFGSGFYLGRQTAPRVVEDRTSARPGQGDGPMIIPLPRGQFERPGPGIVIPNGPNGPTFQIPQIFPQFPMPQFPQFPQSPTTPQMPSQPHG
jgi:hypothetical protein